MIRPNIIAMKNWRPREYNSLGRATVASESAPLDTPDKVWTAGFFLLAVFFVVSYWQIASALEEILGAASAAQLAGMLRLSLSAAALAFVAVVLRRLSLGRVPLKFVASQSWILLGLFLLMVISSVFAGDQVRHSLNYTFDVVFKLAILYMLAMSCLDSARGIRALLWVATLASLVPSLASILLYQFDPTDFDGVTRAVYVGHYSDPNRLAGCLALLIPAAMYLFKTTRSIIGKLAMVFVAFAAVIAILLTGSRGGLLALAAGIMALVWLSKHRFVWMGATVVLSMVVATLLPGMLLSRFSEMKSVGASATAGLRMQIWGAGFRMAVEHPFLGVGTGCYQTSAGDTFMPSNVMGGRERYRFAHSSFIKVLGENGIPAFLLFVALHWVTFRDLFRLRRASLLKRGRDGPMYQLSTAMIAVFASVTIASMTIDYTDDIFPYLFMGAVAALKSVGWSIGLIPKH